MGLFKDWGVTNLTLKRKVKRKLSNKKIKKRKDSKDYTGRTYTDYLEYKIQNPNIVTTEMDAVYNNQSGPYIQTFIFENTSFMIGILHQSKTADSMEKKIVGDFWRESNRLFDQHDGKPIHPSTIIKWFEQFVKKIGLPVINFHCLRHTNATLLISQQVDVATVSARLGHAQITTTYNSYVHPLKSHDRTAGNVLENLLISGKAN